MTARLTENEALLLRHVGDDGGGRLTGDIAVRAWGRRENQRGASAIACRMLKDMLAAGLVRRVDEHKPIIWAITEKGAALLKELQCA